MSEHRRGLPGDAAERSWNIVCVPSRALEQLVNLKVPKITCAASQTITTQTLPNWADTETETLMRLQTNHITPMQILFGRGLPL